MAQRVLIVLVLCTANVGVLAADSQFDVLFGDSYFEADLDLRWGRESSYVLGSVGGVYHEWDDNLYRMLHGTIGFGSYSLIEGLTGEVGLRGLVGQVDRGPRDGAISALGFTASLIYALPDQLSPIPIDLFGDVVVTPEAVSFSRLDGYQEYGVGIRVWLFEKAAITVAYRNREFDMDRHWELSDDIVAVGLSLDF